jgi:hypothetical protein
MNIIKSAYDLLPMPKNIFLSLDKSMQKKICSVLAIGFIKIGALSLVAAGASSTVVFLGVSYASIIVSGAILPLYLWIVVALVPSYAESIPEAIIKIINKKLSKDVCNYATEYIFANLSDDLKVKYLTQVAYEMRRIGTVSLENTKLYSNYIFNLADTFSKEFLVNNVPSTVKTILCNIFCLPQYLIKYIEKRLGNNNDTILILMKCISNSVALLNDPNMFYSIFELIVLFLTGTHTNVIDSIFAELRPKPIKARKYVKDNCLQNMLLYLAYHADSAYTSGTSDYVDNFLKKSDFTNANHLKFIHYEKSTENIYHLNKYVIFDDALDSYIICIRGTDDIYDMVLDGIAVPVFVKIESEYYSFHHGMYIAALKTLERIRIYIDQAVIENKQIICVGHSLGAGVAAILSIIIKRDYDDVYAVGFGVPACVGASVSSCSHIISVVNNYDVVPRMGIYAGCRLTSKIYQLINDNNTLNSGANSDKKNKCQHLISDYRACTTSNNLNYYDAGKNENACLQCDSNIKCETPCLEQYKKIKCYYKYVISSYNKIISNDSKEIDTDKLLSYVYTELLNYYKIKLSSDNYHYILNPNLDAILTNKLFVEIIGKTTDDTIKKILLQAYKSYGSMYNKYDNNIKDIRDLSEILRKNDFVTDYIATLINFIKTGIDKLSRNGVELYISDCKNFMRYQDCNNIFYKIFNENGWYYVDNNDNIIVQKLEKSKSKYLQFVRYIRGIKVADINKIPSDAIFMFVKLYMASPTTSVKTYEDFVRLLLSYDTHNINLPSEDDKIREANYKELLTMLLAKSSDRDTRQKNFLKVLAKVIKENSTMITDIRKFFANKIKIKFSAFVGSLLRFDDISLKMFNDIFSFVTKNNQYVSNIKNIFSDDYDSIIKQLNVPISSMASTIIGQQNSDRDTVNKMISSASDEYMTIKKESFTLLSSQNKIKFTDTMLKIPGTIYSLVKARNKDDSLLGNNINFIAAYPYKMVERSASYFHDVDLTLSMVTDHFMGNYLSTLYNIASANKCDRFDAKKEFTNFFKCRNVTQYAQPIDTKILTINYFKSVASLQNASDQTMTRLHNIMNQVEKIKLIYYCGNNNVKNIVKKIVVNATENDVKLVELHSKNISVIAYSMLLTKSKPLRLTYCKILEKESSSADSIQSLIAIHKKIVDDFFDDIPQAIKILAGGSLTPNVVENLKKFNGDKNIKKSLIQVLNKKSNYYDFIIKFAPNENSLTNYVLKRSDNDIVNNNTALFTKVLLNHFFQSKTNNFSNLIQVKYASANSDPTINNAVKFSNNIANIANIIEIYNTTNKQAIKLLLKMLPTNTDSFYSIAKTHVKNLYIDDTKKMYGLNLPSDTKFTIESDVTDN